MTTIQTKVTIKLLDVLFPEFSNSTKLFIDLLKDLIHHNGTPHTIQYMKIVRLHITRYICKKPLMTNKSLVGLERGFPKRYLFLRKILDSKGVLGKRYILSLLNISRGLEPNSKEDRKIKINYKTITDPYKGKTGKVIPDEFITEFITNLKLPGVYNPDYGPDSDYFSSKSGPGGPSTYNAMNTILKLGYGHWQSILNLVSDHVFNGRILPRIQDAWNRAVEGNPLLPPKTNDGIGKLSIIKDPECKRRIIAMLDYHSQWALKPLHEYLLKILSNIDQDRTFTQDPYNSWGSQGKYYSIDLSAATDRFPIKLQKRVLREIIGYKRSESWESLLVWRDYKAPDGTNIRYNVGQPMGAYSSWAAFTLTHHLVVAWACRKSHIDFRTFKDYIILGDDIVIKNDIVASNYLAIMTKLGVDISPTKTHVSKGTYEFAKRWISDGIEISGLPFGGILRNIKNLKVIYLIVLNYSLKVPLQIRGKLIDVLVEVYSGLQLKGRRYLSSTWVKDHLYHFSMSIRFALGLSTNDELRNYLAICFKDNSQIHIPQGELIHKFIREILGQGMVSAVMLANLESINAMHKFKDYFGSMSSINQLHNHPLLMGIYNSFNTSIKSLKAFNDGSTDIIDTLNNVTFLKVDKIVSMFRNTTETVANLDKLWRKSIKEASSEVEEIYYGSSTAEHSLDTSGWTKVIINNYSNLVEELNKVTLKELKDPEPLMTEEEKLQQWLKAFENFTP